MAKEKEKEKEMPKEKKKVEGELWDAGGGEMEVREQPKERMVLTSKGYWRPERSCRCTNCLERITVPEEATEATCYYCGMKYRMSWPTPDQPRIRGLVWSALPPPGPWPKGWPGELDSENRPTLNPPKKRYGEKK